jgi:hypothetical protein
MDLIPEMGEVIVDPLQLLTEEPVRITKAVSTVKTSAKEMAVVALPLVQGDKRVISIPHLPKFKALSIATGDVRSMDYQFSSAGRRSELWIHDGLSRIAVVRREKRRDRSVIFGHHAYEGIMGYLAEIQRRGVSLTQATDIVCNELCK